MTTTVTNTKRLIVLLVLALFATIVASAFAAGFNAPVTGYFKTAQPYFEWTNTAWNGRQALSSVSMTGRLGQTNSIWCTDISGTNWHEIAQSLRATNTLMYIDGTGGWPLEGLDAGGTRVGKIRFYRTDTNASVRYVIVTRAAP